MDSNKPAGKLLRFWANHREDDVFRIEVDYGHGAEQTVVTFRHNPHPVCNEVELTDADAYAVFFNGEEDERFAGFDKTVDDAWLATDRHWAAQNELVVYPANYVSPEQHLERDRLIAECLAPGGSF